MATDSYYVIKRPSFSCYGGCGKTIKGGIEGMDLVVLEYKPDSILLFLCTACASNRIVLDNLVEELELRHGIVDRYVDRYKADVDSTIRRHTDDDEQ